MAWEVPGACDFLYHCHCSLCRCAHGAAFVSEAIVPAAAFTIVGGEDTLRRHQQRYFCGNCASRLFNRTETGAPLVAVALSTLDDPPEVGPGIHVNVASKAPWVEIPSGATTFPGFPPGVEPEPG